ncbi:hypothetical protein LTR04_005884 [Oleoguttula sp. CCFEE 6159]|nr:hypothetical protein LTR04_005884 [Oleoguttula sp. CCFEE 6159]
MADVHAAFLSLASYLADRNYTFVCPTPESQTRVVDKRSTSATTRWSASLEDFFGWSLPAKKEILTKLLSAAVLKQLQETPAIIREFEDGSFMSDFRFSNLYLLHISNGETDEQNSLYYVHSAHPTKADDAVFFGPDTYFFLDFLSRANSHLPSTSPRRIIDVCCGSGAGAIHMSRAHPNSNVVGLDLNPKALRLGPVNAALAGGRVEFLESDLYAAVDQLGDMDVIVSNPPYIASSEDGKVPIYAAGGAHQGLALPLRIVEEGIEKLAKDGLLIIYTGVPIAYRRPGHDPFLEQIKEMKNAELVEYRIIHPDMWAEDVARGAYTDVGRIQVVGAVLRKTASTERRSPHS